MNPLDLVAIVLIVLAVVLGFRSGALPQICGLIGAVGGGGLAILALPLLVDPLDAIPAGIRPYAVLAGLLAAIGVGEGIGSAVGRYVTGALGTGLARYIKLEIRLISQSSQVTVGRFRRSAPREGPKPGRLP